MRLEGNRNVLDWWVTESDLKMEIAQHHYAALGPRQTHISVTPRLDRVCESKELGGLGARSNT